MKHGIMHRPTHPTVCISIVSHNQGKLTEVLLSSLEQRCQSSSIMAVVTLNLEENFSYRHLNLTFPVVIIRNQHPKGFGANHNFAFTSQCRSDYFCVLNPDIIFNSNPFPTLLDVLGNPSIGVVSPGLTNSQGELQDNARRFPTVPRIFRRIIKKGKTKYNLTEKIFYPDWIAGMFMVFPSRIFSKINGFDERYYMYCEDADICRRLKNNGLKTAVSLAVQAIHNPHRASHRNVRHFWWHIRSLLLFFSQWCKGDTYGRY